MTGYYIEAGYCSGASREEAWAKIKEITNYLCEHPSLIVEEALKFGAPKSADGDGIEYYAQKYKERTDLTIRIKEGIDEFTKEERNQVVQLASGGGRGRVMKEHMRRAFCRLVMYEMHKLELEVNISVG
jgi:hypothetical protein